MASAASRPTTGRPCPGSSGPSKGDGYARLNLGSLCADGKGVPRDWQRARSLFVKATLSPDPRVARKANENLSAMPHQSAPARDRDDTTAAVVGTALVGLALLAIFSGSDEAGGSGAGGGTSTSTGAPFGGGSSPQDDIADATGPAQAHGREHRQESHGRGGKKSAGGRQVASTCIDEAA